MRWNDIISEGRRQPSPELVEWLKVWVESSFKVEDQIEKFQPLIEEASLFLNVRYPALYRGLSISEEDLDQLSAGRTIVVPAHKLQSWTKSRSIADDYALPGYGGDVGALIRKPGGQLTVRLDVHNVLRAMGGRKLLGTDAARESEVIVETDGSLTIYPQNLIRAR